MKLVLPQMGIPLICGIVIDYLSEIGRKINYPELGYTVIFASAILWFLLSMLTVRKIELTNRYYPYVFNLTSQANKAYPLILSSRMK